MIFFIIILIIITIISLTAIIIAFCGKKAPSKTQNNILEVVIKLRLSWFVSALLWMILDYLFTIISFLSSIITVYLASDTTDSIQENQRIIFFSILSAVMVVASFALNPKKHIKAYRSSYEKMDCAINRRCFLINNITDEELVKICNECEKEVGKTYYL